MTRAFLKKRIPARWLALPVDHEGVRAERR